MSAPRRLLYQLAQLHTVADALPSAFHMIVTSGKWSYAAVLAVYLVIVLLLWGPFWLLSFAVGEWGVYAIVVATIFYVGRAIIRMIAFPGASSKVVAEVESEFAKYSVRMLMASANCLRELASAIHTNNNGDGSSSSSANAYELGPLWKRTLSYRDRALGVYLEVLTYIYEQRHTLPPSQAQQQRTRFGTNRIVGDIGNLSGITPQARQDGMELVRLLKKIMQQLDQLEQAAGAILNNPRSNNVAFSQEAHESASLLLASANELRDFISALKPPGDGTDDPSSPNSQGSQQSASPMHDPQGSGGGGALDAIKGGLSSILPMLDPPLHTSIFGMDVLRGTVLSRYLGARQLWVTRSGGAGMLDVLHIPARPPSVNSTTTTPQPRKAVMYCNPNAGLYEVATGMSLAGGNIGEEQPSPDQQTACWTDFYTEMGYDMYVYNYAGFGRSFGTTTCLQAPLRRDDSGGGDGMMQRGIRIVKGLFLAFKPTPDTLRQDGVALANYIVQHQGVASLVIHGESIGGVAASRSAQTLSQSAARDKLKLLVCDRTFCNLEAVAQRLVGTWSGYAIRMLAPLWNTDVAGDFLAAACPKVVANDFADAIVADGSSLKTGVALFREIQRGVSASSSNSTKGIGWVTETPVEYRMADWENVSVVGSQYVRAGQVNRRAPVWPQDKHITLAEAFHFAACAKRIGRQAKQGGRLSHSESMELGGSSDRSVSNPLASAWESLALCDGLCGAPLGAAVKIGFDETVAWLCCLLTYGGQLVVDAAERRLAGGTTMPTTTPATDRPPAVVPADFDQRPEGYKNQESAKMLHPKPVPEVLENVKTLIAADRDAFQPVHHEIDFIVGMLDYIVARLCAPPNVETSWRCKHGAPDETAVGMFLNLHCGHNSAYTKVEQEMLKAILNKVA